ncbi:hypothetical protein Hanom_Chr03g00216571 [Helianthus anomalus]
MWQLIVKVDYEFRRESILISQYKNEFTMDAGSGIIRVGFLGFKGTDFHYSDHIKAIRSQLLVLSHLSTPSNFFVFSRTCRSSVPILMLHY